MILKFNTKLPHNTKMVYKVESTMDSEETKTKTKSVSYITGRNVMFHKLSKIIYLSAKPK